MQYLVDGLNRIIDVDEEWEATAGGLVRGPSLMRSRIIGRPLEGFMTGDATKMFVRAALDAARLLGETRVLPYRCDGPGLLRRFEMVIRPEGDGRVRVDHRLVFSQARLPRRRAPATSEPAGWRCSQCLLVRPVGSAQWFDADITPEALLAQDICPACARQLFGLSATSRG